MYKAFISYKHPESDFGSMFISRFESALKRYAKPWYRAPIRVFRDEVNLKPGADLPALIRDALVRSEFLVLLANPETAQSTWVESEMRVWFEELGRPKERLIIVLTAGSIEVAGRSMPCIDWDRTDALPHVLAQHLTGMPLWIDFTSVTREDRLDLASPVFKSGINRIVAVLRDVDPETMLGEEVAQHRRNLRIRNGAIALLATLAIAATGAAMLAIRAEGRAAEELARTRALLLAAEAEREFERTPQASLTRAIQALSLTERRVPEVERALRRMVARASGDALGALPGPVQVIAVSGDGSSIAAAGGEAVFLWTVEPGNVPSDAQRLGTYSGSANCALFSPSGSYVALGTDNRIDIWRTRDGGVERIDSFDDPGTIRLEFAPDDDWLDMHTRDGVQRVALKAPYERFGRDGATMYARDYATDQRSAYCGTAWARVSPNGAWLLRQADESAVFERLAGSGALPVPFTAYNDRVAWAGFSSDSTYAAALTDQSQMLLFKPVRRAISDVTAAAWFPSARFIAVARTDHRVEIRHLGDQEQITVFGNDAPVTVLAATRSGMLLSGDAQGTVVLWRDLQEHPVARTFSGLAPRRGASEMPTTNVERNEGPLVAFAPDLESVALLADRGGEKVFQVGGLTVPSRPSPATERYQVRPPRDGTEDSVAWAREVFAPWWGQDREERPGSEEPWTLDRSIEAAKWVVMPRRYLPDQALAALQAHGLDGNTLGPTILAGMSSRDRQWLALAGSSGRYGIWFREDQSLRLRHSGLVNGRPVLRFSDDNRWFGIGDDSGDALVYHLERSAEPLRLRGHGSKVTAIAFSPDGDRVVTAGANEALLLWYLEPGLAGDSDLAPVAIDYDGPPIEELAISAQSRWLVAVDTRWDATVWSLDLDALVAEATRRIARRLEP